ncbi:MAG TPA: hypothetical protein VMN36_02385, partial [Verrucomicrobiales bacterium]|nr:hypothetical protein [Verrucomicrobiales bacterium]
MWNDPLTRRTFLKNTGVSSAAVLAGAQGLRAASSGGDQTSSGGLIKVVAVSPDWQPYNSATAELNQWGFVGLVIFSGPTERLRVIVRDISQQPFELSVQLGAGRSEWKSTIQIDGRREKLTSQDGTLQWIAHEKKTLELNFAVKLNAQGEIVGGDAGSTYQATAGDLTVAARQSWDKDSLAISVQGSVFWKPQGVLEGAKFLLGPLQTEWAFGGGATKSLGPVTIAYTFAKV